MRSLSLPEGQLARIAPEVCIIHSIEAPSEKKNLKFLEALEKVRSWGLLEGNSARYTPVVYVVYGIEALGKRFLKVLKALESRKIESVRCSQKPHFH